MAEVAIAPHVAIEPHISEPVVEHVIPVTILPPLVVHSSTSVPAHPDTQGSLPPDDQLGLLLVGLILAGLLLALIHGIIAR